MFSLYQLRTSENETVWKKKGWRGRSPIKSLVLCVHNLSTSTVDGSQLI